MAVSPWPATLPQQFLQGTFQETFPDNLLRTQMDAGPVKLRRRTTAAPALLQGEMHLDSTQWVTFATFYLTTLRSGSLPYSWVHPFVQNVILVRFVGVPSYRRVGADTIVTLDLEVMP
ncbi:MAG: hypothetical protein ACREM3_30035 [Candidatus Rokuibacteriota bacterium]